MHRLSHRPSEGDRGAVAVTVAVLMVALLGFGTIVLDAGVLYAERRQLQNGADAAALAVVMDCPSSSGCDTGTSATSLAGRYATVNANDGTAAASTPCGRGANLTACSPESGLGPWDCRPLPAGPLAGADYVQVRTETRAGGTALVLPLLARVLDPGYDGTTVRACARASWGPPAGLRSQLPLAISQCEFGAYTSAGLSSPPFTSAQERVIKFHTQSGAAGCPASGSGADLPGGFGWLNTSEDCQATTDTTNWVLASTGAPPPNTCSNAELQAMIGQIVNVPIFDSTNGLNGANGKYHISGYGAFYLTGYVFPGAKEKSILSNVFPCSGPDHCISGVFTTDPTPPGGTIGSGPDFGTTVFQMSG